MSQFVAKHKKTNRTKKFSPGLCCTKVPQIVPACCLTICLPDKMTADRLDPILVKNHLFCSIKRQMGKDGAENLFPDLPPCEWNDGIQKSIKYSKLTSLFFCSTTIPEGKPSSTKSAVFFNKTGGRGSTPCSIFFLQILYLTTGL